ncbi:MAG TPA: Tim44/TimA family putative adaptor protein [Rhizomicrobium sp.]|jgi:predicted lipid-binding transport protein (Tim44 family)|nr:Tim44/TimA family putative adaptor protein [Rhizomicrobium sp.]
MPNSPFLEIVILAAIAAVILFRLYTVLGRRTGTERTPQERYGLTGPGQPGDNVVTLPDRARVAAPSADSAADPAARGLLDIKLADRNFETEHFLSGARSAYEIIVTAFAAGERVKLKPLLNDEVYAAFDSVIHSHEEKHEKVSFTFVGFSDVKIVHAEMKDRTAEITVSFAAKYISTTAKEDGEVVDGDPKNVREVTDIWTFARDTGARDPNWTLIATSGGQH